MRGNTGTHNGSNKIPVFNVNFFGALLHGFRKGDQCLKEAAEYVGMLLAFFLWFLSMALAIYAMHESDFGWWKEF